MRNITLIIASHNKSILRPKSKEYGCNRRNKESCSLQNRCLTAKVIYKNTVTNNGDDEKRMYFGNSDTIFKVVYNIATIQGILIKKIMLIVQSYRNTFSNKIE